jgi:leucyl-tRNA synthetase
MELVNQMYQVLELPARDGPFWSIMKGAVEAMILLVAPIVPHIAEELWQALGHSESVMKAPWPEWHQNALQVEDLVIVVQVNGKLRGRIMVSAQAAREQIEQAALQDVKTREFVAGRPVKKIVVVPGKLVNIVV